MPCGGVRWWVFSPLQLNLGYLNSLDSAVRSPENITTYLIIFAKVDSNYSQIMKKKIQILLVIACTVGSINLRAGDLPIPDIYHLLHQLQWEVLLRQLGLVL